MHMLEEMVKCKSESEFSQNVSQNSSLEEVNRSVELDNIDTEYNSSSINCAVTSLDHVDGNFKNESSHSDEVKKEVTDELSEEVTHVKTEYGFKYAVKVHDFRTLSKLQTNKCDSKINKIKAEEKYLKVEEYISDTITWEDEENTISSRECILDTVCYELDNQQPGVSEVDQEPASKDLSSANFPFVEVKTEVSSDTEDTKFMVQDDDSDSEASMEADRNLSLSTVEELSANIADQDFEEVTDADYITNLALTSIKQEVDEEEISGVIKTEAEEEEEMISCVIKTEEEEESDEDVAQVKRRGRKKKIPTDIENDGKPTVYEFDLEYIVKHGFNEYIRVFKGRKPFQCSMCSFHETSRYRLWHHYKRHLGKEPVYRCHVCQKVFNTRPGLRVHMEIHNDIKPFMCSDCGKAFHHRGALLRHVETHKKTKQFPCDICGAILRRRDSLNEHLKTHSNVKPFRCDHCNKRFSRKSLLWGHMQSHSDLKPYSCTECSNDFKTLTSLKRHMATAHFDTKPFICHICKKPFKRSDQLKEHARTHTDATPYKCKFCDKSFRHIKTRNNHQNKFHLKYSSFQCQHCSIYVSSNRIMKKHYKRYKLPKEVKCKYCPEKFTFECIFRKHMKTHKKEKREDLYKCKRCKKVLSSKESLRRHSIVCKKINSKKKVKCSYCGKAYVNGNYFQKHLELHKMQKK